MVIIRDNNGRKLFTLEEILGSEKLIMVDNGVCEDSVNWYYDGVYPCRFFYELDK
tara:strand:- start:205 stop:369 length:165 start_codon:yes stop_codon:yes gene_type:complete